MGLMAGSSVEQPMRSTSEKMIGPMRLSTRVCGPAGPEPSRVRDIHGPLVLTDRHLMAIPKWCTLLHAGLIHCAASAPDFTRACVVLLGCLRRSNVRARSQQRYLA